MAAGAAPSLLQSGGGLAPFLVSMILLAFGAGMKPGPSPNILVPLLTIARSIQE